MTWLIALVIVGAVSASALLITFDEAEPALVIVE